MRYDVRCLCAASRLLPLASSRQQVLSLQSIPPIWLGGGVQRTCLLATGLSTVMRTADSPKKSILAITLISPQRSPPLGAGGVSAELNIRNSLNRRRRRILARMSASGGACGFSRSAPCSLIISAAMGTTLSKIGFTTIARSSKCNSHQRKIIVGTRSSIRSRPLGQPFHHGLILLHCHQAPNHAVHRTPDRRHAECWSLRSLASVAPAVRCR